MKKLILFILGFLVLSTGQTAENAILFIGDGLGPSVITATRMHFLGKGKNLFLDTMPYTAKVKTYSKGYQVTDSAAGATAMSTGVKVESGVLGRDASASPPNYGGFTMGKNKQGKPLKNLLELAKAQGKSVGIVTTTHIFHATPAAFYAHVNDRNNFDGITKSLSESSVDLIMGGGEKKYKKFEKVISKRFKRVTKLEDLKKCPKEQTLGLFSDSHIPYVYDKVKGRVKLWDMVKVALNCLSQNKKGFVLMVEGGRIDHALHERKIIHALHEMYEFDLTIRFTVKELKAKNKLKNTIILSTADHDTGGLAINAPLNDQMKMIVGDKITETVHYSGEGAYYPVLKLSTDKLNGKNQTDATHTGVDVDLYAIGAGADKVNGTIENTDVFKILKKELSL